MGTQVSNAVLTAMAAAAVAGVVIPVALMIVLKVKYKLKMVPFFIGCATFLLFAVILEPILHQVVLKGPYGSTIMNNIWLYGLYGALAAATFEEVGRFLAMRFILSKRYDAPGSGVMYGAGHGGIECLYILTVGMLSNIVIAILYNSGNIALLTGGMGATEEAQLGAMINALAAIKPTTFLISILERIIAVTGHIVMSLLVWRAATGKREMKCFALAFAMHFILDFMAVIVNNFFGVAAAEIAIMIFVAAMLYGTMKIYQKDKK